MILITGATGQLGTAVLNKLLKSVLHEDIVVFARNISKAQKWKDLGLEVRIGDFNDVGALEKACKGIDQLLLFPTNDQDAFQQHSKVIDAAVKMGVSHFYYAGGALNHDVEHSKVGPLRESYHSTENYIRKSGLKYTICQNGLYSETLPFFIGEQISENGIYFPSGSGKASFASRDDMGEAIANLITSGHNISATYILTGEQSYSFGDIAAMLTEITGKKVSHISPDLEAFKGQLSQYGVNDDEIYMTSLLAEIIENGEYDVPDFTLSQLLGREPQSLKAYLEQTYRK